MGPNTGSPGQQSVFPRHIILSIHCDAAVSMIHSKQTVNNIIEHYKVLHHIADTLVNISTRFHYLILCF